MSKPLTKKIILLIVEGITDQGYLMPLQQCIRINSSKKIDFYITEGDILTDKETNLNNFKIKIGVTVQNYIEESKIDPSDIYTIIHVVDLDGVYIKDENVESDSSLDPKQTIYSRNKIANLDRINIIERNTTKSAMLDELYNTSAISYSEKIDIPYRIYYFSTNIDDYFCGKQNATTREKFIESDFIYNRYYDYPDEYRNFIESNYCSQGTYIDTWEYVKKDYNSLSRCSNFNKFFTEIIDKL